MNTQRVARAIEQATDEFDRSHDPADFLAWLLTLCQDVLNVDAAGVMVRWQGGSLQLLGASSHRAAEIEFYQSQVNEGPCWDAATEGELVDVSDPDTARSRWPTFGPRMLDAGFQAVHSTPLRHAGRVFGAMALFRKDGRPFDDVEDRAAQLFADLVARSIMLDDTSQTSDPLASVGRALERRVVIEQAKGVIAQITGTNVGDAYERLLHIAKDRKRTLTETATDILREPSAHLFL